ncbi:MAG: hypothetical protein K6E12_03445 [Saccharofermentans sp.]|nr:hypothetical protein [Saccharofermentans sp.]
MNEELYNSLSNSLNMRHGIPEPNKESDEIFQIKWPGNIAFTVCENKRFGWFYVERNHQVVSSVFHYRNTPDSRDIGIMQNLIDEADAGKYNNKKTLSERIRDEIELRHLTSCMNNTKWREMLDDISEIPDLTISYKSLFDETEPESSWKISEDEHLRYMKLSEIEWFKINDVTRRCSRKGLLLDPEISEEKIKDKIEGILQKHSIYYEYEEDTGVFTVFGYK